MNSLEQKLQNGGKMNLEQIIEKSSLFGLCCASDEYEGEIIQLASAIRQYLKEKIEKLDGKAFFSGERLTGYEECKADLKKVIME